MATGEAFAKWLEKHQSPGPSDKGTVKVTLAYSMVPGPRPAWNGGSDTRTYEVIGYDELGIIVKAANAQFDDTIFYPWASIYKIE